MDAGAVSGYFLGGVNFIYSPDIFQGAIMSMEHLSLEGGGYFQRLGAIAPPKPRPTPLNSHRMNGEIDIILFKQLLQQLIKNE